MAGLTHREGLTALSYHDLQHFAMAPLSRLTET
jgi:hypothetical protein